MGKQNVQESDRRAAILKAFDSMTDEAQCAALGMLQSIARGSPRRPAPVLQLVARGNKGLHLVSATSGI